MKKTVIKIIDLLNLHNHNSKKYPFLLESVTQNNTDKSYSILFAFPKDEIVLNNLEDFDFLTVLKNNILKEPKKSNIPFSGGWFVYLSYECAAQIEPVLLNTIPLGDKVKAYAVRIPSAVIIDHSNNQSYIIDEDDNDNRINEILNDISSIQEVNEIDIKVHITEEDPNKFINMIKKCKNYIVEGDIFQANISRWWQVELDNNITCQHIYKKLRSTNPAPFSALADYKGFQIISSSPERLFNVKGRYIQTRPIAGTHPRGVGDKDKELINRLLHHHKEQAEHIMLVDLERNDLGRVCEFGSVKADEIMFLETYSYVHHIVSNIIGKLKKDCNIKDIIAAIFPGGTITGCPKIRSIEIISELEKTPRYFYTGSLGYISNNGNMDFNILIRSFMKEKNKVMFRTGAGIVFDSVAGRELKETYHKAEGLLKAFTF